MKELGGTAEIVIPAVLLNDIGDTAIDSDDLEKQTINPEACSSEKSYSTDLKQQHLNAGKRLSKEILRKAGYTTVTRCRRPYPISSETTKTNRMAVPKT